jgi:rSAM/selenodomain-associated transferase 2
MEHFKNIGVRQDFSVVIPTLNAIETLGETIRALVSEAGGPLEVVVVDGGSGDGTGELAASLGAKVLEAPRGRGIQLLQGARHASGAWLLFLHADTRLQPGWHAEARAFMGDPGNAEQAAVFRLAFDSPRLSARLIERAAAWRARAFGLAYGDQALLISRSFYESLGGHPALPIMEDVELMRRIGKRRLVILKTKALTSARRYEREGYLKRGSRNLACLALYRLGVPAQTIARLYR